MYVEDNYRTLSISCSSENKLKEVFSSVESKLGAIERIAVTLYHEDSDMVKTYISVNRSENPLVFYETPLQEAPGLLEVKNKGMVRVIGDMGVFAQGRGLHTRMIAKRGFLSSFTFPMFRDSHFIGFIFINAAKPNFFNEEAIEYLVPICHSITDFIFMELFSRSTMLAAFRTANTFLHFKDPETGEHLERMARYSELIALELARAGEADFNDRDIEAIFMFAPLHDIGKIAIPDRILLKPASLDDDERAKMQTHTTHGKKIIDEIIKAFQLEVDDHIRMIHDIVELHHEFLDGSGYPHGLSGDAVPIVSRIITVSDIFDALTSNRPYKKAWTNDKAFAELDSLTKSKIDVRCVEILKDNIDKVISIQSQFGDTIGQRNIY